MSNSLRPDRALESARQSLREMDERFQLLVESVKDYAIFILDPDGVITTWNSGAERIKGYKATEIIGKHFSVFYPEDDVRSGKCEMELEAAIAEGRFEDEGWRIRKDGSRFWANVIITCLRDARGDVIGFAKVTRDLTERKAAEEARVRLAEVTAAREEAERALEQLSRLQELTGLLAAASTPNELVSIVVEKGAVALRAEAASFTRWDGKHLRLMGFTGMADTLPRKLADFDLNAKIPQAVAILNRRSEWVESADDYARRYPDALEAVTPTAVCSLPLAVGEDVVGAITFPFAPPHAFTVLQRVFMETFANQVAQAFARTESHARELEGKRRLEALGALAAALSSALTTNDVADAVVECGRRAATADTCMLYVLDESSRVLELRAERNCNPTLVEKLLRITPEAENAMYAPITTGKAIWIQNDEDYAACFPWIARTPVSGPRARAFWAVPLVAEGAPIGLLAMGFHQPTEFPPEERDFVETLGRYCSEALLRARRLEAEREARTIAERLQASLATTLRSIGDAVIATDAKGCVTITNPVADELTGWPEEEARGRPLHEVFRILNEHTRTPVTSPVEKVLELGTVIGLANHTVLVHRDGRRETPIDDSAAPIRGPDGAIAGVVLVFRDVTEKKRDETRRSLLADATAALSESLDYELTLAKVAKLAVPRLADWCAVDVVVDGRERAKRLAVAHLDEAKVQYARRLGEKYPRDPNAAVGVANVLRTGKPELYPEVGEDILRRGVIDEEHLRSARSFAVRSAMVVPLIARGRTVGAMTFAWAESGHTYSKDDLAFAEELARRCAVAIENARLYAAEQHARQSADIANRAKDEFLAMVSHELRTPLNAIMGWAKMMSSSALDEKKRVRAIETIDRNAVAMAQLIEDLLDVSRIISGKMRLEVQNVDLGRIVDAAIESVRPAAEAKVIRITQTIDGEIPSLVGDPTRLQQIVWNLLSNAVKFTPKGGLIDVRVAREDSGIVIRVTDTGKGIAPDFLPHVFDPFRQQDASHTRSRGGLGLGLAITRQLVELHGGQVEAYSEGEGHGATFTVHLPIAAITTSMDTRTAETRQIRLESSFERPKQLRGIRVLVVDDEEDARQLVKAILDECGCEVTLAGSVAEAMAILEKEIPDVLISDIGMPQQDGYDLIRQVRSLPVQGAGNLPAAALTAYARTEDRRRVLNAGYSMHIPKPVEPSELIAVVVSLTRSVQRPSESSPTS